MRDMNDLKCAFGQADEGFVNTVYTSLANMRKDENRRPAKRRGVRLAIALAVVIALSAGTALALTNTWGILDYLRERRNGTDVLPQAGEIIQTNVPQVAEPTELASFSVREAAFDGHNYYILVDVKPSDPEYLLLGPDAFPQDPVVNMGPIFLGKTGTIAEYAEAYGQKLIQTNVSVSGVNGGGVDYILQQDGTLTYLMNGSLTEDSDKANLELKCIVAPFEKKDGEEAVLQENIMRSSLDITLENTGIRELVSSTASAEYTDCGVRIDSITLKGSEMAVYAEIRYTVLDETKFDATDAGLEFEFVDGDGNRLPDGTAVGGGTKTEDGVHYIQESSLGAMETLPREIAVRGFNCWEKNKYETHTFEMK